MPQTQPKIQGREVASTTESEQTLPFADIAHETAPNVPNVRERLQWAVHEGQAHDLPIHWRSVLWYICWRAGGTDGLCMVSRKTISRETGVKPDMLKKVLPQLVKMGLIRTSRRRKRDHFRYQPTCIRGASQAPHECFTSTPRVLHKHPSSAPQAPLECSTSTPLTVNQNINEKQERERLTPARARAGSRLRREEIFSEEENGFLRKLERYAGVHTWTDLRAAARTYTCEPDRWSVDRDRWDLGLAKQGRCAYCGADSIRPDEWIRQNREDGFGLCPNCMKGRPVEPLRSVAIQAKPSRY